LQRSKALSNTIIHYCRAKTKTGSRCKNQATFFYCNLHWKRFINWKTVVGGVATVMIFLGGLGGFFTDFFFPLREKVSETMNPPDYWECDQDKNIRGIIMPNIKGSIGSNNEVVFLFGFDNPIMLPVMLEKPNQSACLFLSLTDFFKNYCSVKYKIAESRLLLSAEIFDIDGCLAGKIVDNEFVLNKNCQFTWNSDDYGFEIIDSNFDVIFSINFEPPNKLSFQGIFYDGEYFVVVPEPKYELSDTSKDEHSKLLHHGPMAVGVPKEDKATLEKMKKSLKPLFEYLGKDWFGKRKVY